MYNDMAILEVAITQTFVKCIGAICLYILIVNLESRFCSNRSLNECDTPLYQYVTHSLLVTGVGSVGCHCSTCMGC